MPRLRRLRALIVFSAIWAVAWVPLGILLTIVNSLRQGLVPSFSNLTNLLAGIPLVMGAGAFCGFVFGLAFGAGERSRRFESLSLARAIAWGIVGATAIPLTATLVNPPASLFGAIGNLLPFALLGGVCGGAMLAIARRAPRALAASSPAAAISSESAGAP